MCRRTSSLLAANIAPSSSWVTGQIGRPPSRHRYGQGCSVDSCRRSPPHRQCPNRHRRDPEPADATTAQLGVVACKEPAMCELIPAHARHRLDYRAVTRLRLVPAGPPGRDHTEQLVARKRQRSFPQSFHQPLLGLTGAYWLDDPPDVSSKDSTQQCRVDDPLLSCTQQRGLRVVTSRKLGAPSPGVRSTALSGGWSTRRAMGWLGMWLRRGLLLTCGKPSALAAAEGPGTLGLAALADQPQGQRIPVGLAVARLDGGQ
jgi:hypothetical protein